MKATSDATKSAVIERLEASLAHIRNEGAKVFTDVFVDSARREAEAADQRTAECVTLGPLGSTAPGASGYKPVLYGLTVWVGWNDGGRERQVRLQTEQVGG